MFIKRQRESSGMTQSELSDILNVSRSTLAMWETGKSSPPVDKLIKMARILHCTVDELLRVQEAVGEWCPVWYRLLPREKDKVIVTDGETVTVGCYLGDDKWDTTLPKVTHWRPFPMPPGWEYSDELARGDTN